jgi:hypothetical protein
MRIVVTEYPKSGGSWIVSVLGYVLDLPKRDIYVGDGYDRFDVAKHPWYQGQPSLNLTESCVIKSHEFPKSTWIAFPADFVHLVRDGRDVVVSKYFFERDFCVLNGIYERFDTPFDDYVPQVAREWRDYVFAWLEACPYSYKYEDFLRDPHSTLRRLLDDLGLSVPEKRIVDGFSAHTKEKFSRSLDDAFRHNTFVRKATVGDWRNHFTEAHIRIFEDIAGDALAQLGYK